MNVSKVKKEDVKQKIEDLEKLYKNQVKEKDELHQYKTGAYLNYLLGNGSLIRGNLDSAEIFFKESLGMHYKNIKIVTNFNQNRSESIRQNKLLAAKSLRKLNNSILEKVITNLDIQECEGYLLKQLPNSVNRIFKESEIRGNIQVCILKIYSRNMNRLFLTDEDINFLTTEKNFSNVNEIKKKEAIAYIFQSLAKMYRKDAPRDKNSAKLAENYRRKSATLFEKIGVRGIAQEEITEAALFKLYQASSKDEFEREYIMLNKELNKCKFFATEGLVDFATYNKNNNYFNANALIYGINFIEKGNYREKIKFFKNIGYRFGRVGSLTSMTFNIYTHYYELIADILTAKNFKNISEKLPIYKKKIERIIGNKKYQVEAELQLIVDNFLSISDFLDMIDNEEVSERVENSLLDSILVLRKQNIIEEKLTLELFKGVVKKISEKIVSPIDLTATVADDDDTIYVERVLKDMESSVVEIKKSTKLVDAIGRTLSAFANCEGGSIYIGLVEKLKETSTEEKEIIADQYILYGMPKDIDQHRQNLIDHLRNKLKNFEINSLKIKKLRVKQENILEVSVPSIGKINHKPIFYDGKAYVRNDCRNDAVKYEELPDLISKLS